MKLRLLIFWIAFLISFLSQARADIKVALLGSADYSFFQNGLLAGGLGFGGGGLIELQLSGPIGIETGFFYLRRPFHLAIGGVSLLLTTHLYGDIPLVIRTSLSNLFSIGVGLFYDIPFSPIISAFYGLTGDLRFYHPLSSRFRIIFQPRFSYDLKNSSPNQVPFLSVLLGLQLSI